MNDAEEQKPCDMSSAEYEEVTSQIAKKIFEQVVGVPPIAVKYAEKSKVPGASGYEHQIDVSVKGSQDLLLIECKCWNYLVSTVPVLTFAARLCDIGHAPDNRGQIQGILATTRGFQPGAVKLAEYFGIKQAYVRSAEEFVMKYKALIAASFTDRLDQWKDGFQKKLE